MDGRRAPQVVYTKGKLYMGMLYAPVFAAVRYGLGRYNADLKKRGYLLPWYTLAANLLA